MLPRAAVLIFSIGTVLVAACTDDSVSPEPRSSPEGTAASLVRDGARPVWVRSGDLDGDDVEELAVASYRQVPTGFTVPYLEVFRLTDSGWRRVFDATGNAPPGAGAPAEMLTPLNRGHVSQTIRGLRLVDFAGDGVPEIVVAIQTFGATEGPLELWVLSMGAEGSLTTEFYRASSRGGDVVRVQGNQLRFEYHVYRDEDPGCCPTFTDRVIIGWNQASGRIEVLERIRRPSGLGLG